MNKFFLICLVSFFTSTAHAFFFPWCSLSYRAESYSLGLQFGYEDIEAKPVMMDEYCWKLGENLGQELTQHNDSRRCPRAYADGKKLGLHGELLTITSPSECSHAGHTVGLSMLSVYARESAAQNDGNRCGKEYLLGKKDARANRPGTIRSDNRLNHCYFTGYNDLLSYGE